MSASGATQLESRQPFPYQAPQQCNGQPKVYPAGNSDNSSMIAASQTIQTPATFDLRRAS